MNEQKGKSSFFVQITLNKSDLICRCTRFPKNFSFLSKKLLKFQINAL